MLSVDWEANMSRYGKFLECILQSMSTPLHVSPCHRDKGQLGLCRPKFALLEVTPQPIGWGAPCLPTHAMVEGGGGFLGDEVLLCQHIGTH